MKLGRGFCRITKRNGMTQIEVADALHISYQAVSKWERDVSLSDITLLPGIADLFQISIDELLGNSYSGKAKEILESDQDMDEDVQQAINQKITDIVNREFEIGRIEGKHPRCRSVS